MHQPLNNGRHERLQVCLHRASDAKTDGVAHNKVRPPNTPKEDQHKEPENSKEIWSEVAHKLQSKAPPFNRSRTLLSRSR